MRERVQSCRGTTHLDDVRHEVGQLLVELDLLLVLLDLILLVLHLVVELRDLLLVDVDLGLDHARLAQDGVGRHPAPRPDGEGQQRAAGRSAR
jgi:hypothetical protein